MRVRRSTVESLIINLVMVKEEDKGRGCIPVDGMGGCFHAGFFPDYFGNVAVSMEIGKN
jgi:hypothetical protein